MGVVIRKPGVLTTIQDRGRYGNQRNGFSVNGAMDKRAFEKANILVDNPKNSPVMEFVLAGPRLRFTTSTIFALTGANFNAKLNDRPIDCYRANYARRGSILELTAPKSGMYGYLAIAGGGFAVPAVMGSASTNIKCGFGGYKGRNLEIGDYIESATTEVDFLPYYESHRICSDEDFYAFDKDEVEIRVVMGPEDDAFTSTGIAKFFGSSYTATGRCDRMGYRLDGPQVEAKDTSDIISEAVSTGSIQIPTDGHPIVMMADCQTTGGYAKIASVATVDIPKLVQRSQGKRVKFVPISVEEAQNLLIDEARTIRKLARHVKRPSAGSVSPRRTARRLTPILEKQAKINTLEHLWIKTASLPRRVGNRNTLEKTK